MYAFPIFSDLHRNVWIVDRDHNKTPRQAFADFLTFMLLHPPSYSPQHAVLKHVTCRTFIYLSAILAH
jgi:hypothetical protein